MPGAHASSANLDQSSQVDLAGATRESSRLDVGFALAGAIEEGVPLSRGEPEDRSLRV
jgi:hypothetical protein